MLFEINWTIVSLSFAAATVLFYLYLLALAWIRKAKAEKQVILAQARLQQMIDALKEKNKKSKET